MNYTISFCTLGCRVNQYESYLTSEKLAEYGFVVKPFGEKCDFAVVNSCTVTAESDRKSRQMIRRAAKYADKGVFVTGCFAEISPDEAMKIDGVLAVVGNRNKSHLADVILHRAGLIAEAPVYTTNVFEECTGKLTCPERVRTFVKIEDGCESKCAYCIIPKARGSIRSKDPREIFDEVKALVKAGSPEIILTGIEISAYGKDFKGNAELDGCDLSHLISEVSQIEGMRRLGLGSLDPTVMTEDFLGRISEVPKLIRHFHLSLQSGCSSVLKRMRRRYNADQAMMYMERVRRYFPDANISADVIVGFPGETEAEFEATAEFCRKADFLNLHIFPYSTREGTEAAAMEGQLPDSEKKRRVSVLEAIHAETKKTLMERYSDRKSPVYVLFEQKKNGYLTGHSEHYVEFKVKGSADLVGKICPVIPMADGTADLV